MQKQKLKFYSGWHQISNRTCLKTTLVSPNLDLVFFIELFFGLPRRKDVSFAGLFFLEILNFGGDKEGWTGFMRGDKRLLGFGGVGKRRQVVNCGFCGDFDWNIGGGEGCRVGSIVGGGSPKLSLLLQKQ